MPTHPSEEMSLDELSGRAVAALNRVAEDLPAWTEAVRPDDGQQGRFAWAVETTRPVNVAATAYLLGGLRKMGLYERVISAADETEGLAWVKAMETGEGTYDDPAFHRPSPDWPAAEAWPKPEMKLAVNQYAGSVHRIYSHDDSVPKAPPPPEWPQPASIDTALAWVQSRPWATNPWSAGSHSMRMATYMVQWYKEGRIAFEPLLEVLRWFYDTQNPETGLWGGAETSLHLRINGTFKLFPLLREQLDLPLPHAEKVIDTTLTEFYRPDYDDTVGGCDEWDNWYVIALALEQTADHRGEEIRRLAAWRIGRVLEIFAKPDGGLSYASRHCAPNWVGFDMAPQKAQSDCMGPGILAGGINVCIDLLDLQDASPWTGAWRLRADEREDDELRQRIIDGVFNR